jgi:hypothetical protein
MVVAKWIEDCVESVGDGGTDKEKLLMDRVSDEEGIGTSRGILLLRLFAEGENGDKDVISVGEREWIGCLPPSSSSPDGPSSGITFLNPSFPSPVLLSHLISSLSTTPLPIFRTFSNRDRSDIEWLSVHSVDGMDGKGSVFLFVMGA